MMKKILVTGCNGQLGRAIRQEYKGEDVSFINTDVAEGEGIVALDITDVNAVLALVRAERPDVIINCAAHTNVDACEQQWDAEFDEIHPVSAYGKTKAEGEKFVREFADRYFIFRTAWLYGDGKNFVKTMLRLAESHDEVSVVCDQQGSPTSAVELARAIHHFEPTENYGTFHATCEGDTNWAAFAEAIFKRAGKTTKVNHVTSEQYAKMNPASANRPAYSILENYMMKLTDGYKMAEWQDALDEYMKTLE